MKHSTLFGMCVGQAQNPDDATISAVDNAMISTERKSTHATVHAQKLQYIYILKPLSLEFVH